MSNKIKKILMQIENGQRTSLYDIEITLAEFLSKDESGISFLEHLLKKHISINASNLMKLDNSLEAAFLFLKYHEDLKLYSLDFDEDNLFSPYEDKRLIDVLIERKALNPTSVEKVKNHLEIVELISDSKYYLDRLNSKIIDMLTTKDEFGNYPIEKYLNCDFFAILIGKVNNLTVLNELYEKYQNKNILENINENLLMKKVDKNKTLLEDLLSKNIIPKILYNIPTNPKFINFLRKLKLYDYLKKSSEHVMLIKVTPGKTLLEDIIKHGIDPEIRTIFSKETLRILNKMNKLNVIGDIDEGLLTSSVKDALGKGSRDKLFLDYLLANGIIPSLKSQLVSNEEIIKLYYKYGNYEFLAQKLAVPKLFIEYQSGRPLIKELLEKNYNIKLNINLYSDDIKYLLDNKFNDGITYFDFILQNIKEHKIKCNLNSLMNCLSKIDQITLIYFALAKQDMMEYVDKLDEEKLLKKYYGRSLLEHLLEQDREITLNNLLTDKVKSKLKIATIINAYGLTNENVDIPLETMEYANDYLVEKEMSFGIGPLPVEGEMLLNKLKELFDNDGVSDKKLITSLIAGYRQALFENYQSFINELRTLVKLKENNLKKFVYIKIDDGAYYSLETGKISSDKNIVDTILHETGHLLHDYLMNMEVPDNFLAAVKKLRTDVNLLKKVESYATKYTEIKEKIIENAEKKYALFFKEYYTDDKLKEIDEFIEKSLTEKKQEFKSLNISDATLDIILSNSFTREEYIKHQKRVFINEYVQVVLFHEFGSFTAVGDILDAIYEGELHSGKLKNATGELINKTAGHGISYYYGYTHCFSEIIANFAAIVKSREATETLNFLQSLIGEDLLNIISDYYYKNIVNGTVEEKKTDKHL